MENIEQQNSAVKNWSSQGLREIQNSYKSMISGRSGVGYKSLKLRTRKSFGEITQITFGLVRYLVWVHKGAGKGHGGAKGSTWFRNGKKVKTDSSSLGKMDSNPRFKKEFLNPILNQEIPKLADIVSSFKADLVVKSIQIK